uniref:Uncharacterized protein n=1 Tax=Arundo donax TaxID=35708 RepID=A0A0A8ZRC4_ARUDO
MFTASPRDLACFELSFFLSFFLSCYGVVVVEKCFCLDNWK